MSMSLQQNNVMEHPMPSLLPDSLRVGYPADLVFVLHPR